jgi:hypothetical protein
MEVPKPGSQVTIVSLGSDASLLSAPIRSVMLLGSRKKLVWSKRPEGLVITCPNHMPSKIAVAFKIQ